jgi:NTE family protein
MKRLKVGLALSGGTAKSVAHIGVLKAVVEFGLRIDYLAGTSGGSLVAAFYAAGKSIEEIEALAGGIHWRNIAGLTIPRLGLLSSDKIRKFVADEIGDVEFDDLTIPVAIVASDLTTGKGRVLTSGSVAVACQASSSIPEFYTPVEVDGHILIDGGFSEYVPVAALSSLGDMFTIGVNLGFEKGLKDRPRNIVDMTLQVANFIAQQNAAASERRADFLIRPDLSRFGPLELHKASDIIRQGYVETRKALPALSAALKDFKPGAAQAREKSL